MDHVHRYTDAMFSPPRADEVDALASVMGAALHIAPERMRESAENLGIEHVRAMRQADRVVGGIYYGWMGQWFGGKRVPTVGLCGVGIVPDQRGTGVGSLMLHRALAELRGANVPLSVLYPATLPYYQRGGYERAGYRITYELPLEAIDVRDSTLDLMVITPAHYPAIEQAYTERARRVSGNLDRPAWMWRQRLEPKDQQPLRYLVQRDGHIEGYVVFTQASRADPLTVLDICILTPAAGRRLLTLFSGYRSMVEHLVWNGGPLDPLLYLIGENFTAGSRSKVKIIRPLEWMLRIVDVAGALEARGYAPDLHAELHLDIHDDVLPDNNGRWLLQVADGQAHVRPGGQGRIALGVRELAAIYTGFIAPAELRAIGTIAGPEAELALLGALFAGPRPWVADMF